MIKFLQTVAICTLFIAPTYIYACTIFCGKDNKGHIWAANNEDNAFSFVNFINVFPKTEDTKYGYYTLSYFTVENGENFNIHGGMNEAGLFYDFNSIPTVLIKDLHKKKTFPEGSQRILSYILENFETVNQVVDFFEEYWFEVGFNSAQMHVADKFGGFAIISPSGSRVLKNERYQISTNFDICGGADSKTCWRYPIVDEELGKNEIGWATFRDIAQKTSQKGLDGNYTIYSNIQNLNTGEIWFYFLSDYKNPFKTSMAELLSKGRKSYLIRDLFKEHPVTSVYDDFVANGGKSAFENYRKLDISTERKKELLSIFVNHFIGTKNNMEAIFFLEEYLKMEPVGYWMRAKRAIYHFQKGDKTKAKSIVTDYKNEVPDTSMDVERILNLFEGNFSDEANATIRLNGYQDARHVFVKGLPVPFNFLIKKDGVWQNKYKLSQGIYNYSFVVDGLEVFDSKTPITTVTSEFNPPYLAHQLCIGLSKESYLTTINVKVPNKDDVVYIAGNQSAMTNWNSVFRLKKISDFEREIRLKLHFPAKFKFTRGNWETEAVMKDTLKDEDGRWPPMTIDFDSNTSSYQITGWKDR